MQETQGLQPLGQEDPLEKEWLPTPLFLPGQVHEQRSLAGYSPWGLRVGHNWSNLALIAKKSKALKNHWTELDYINS